MKNKTKQELCSKLGLDATKLPGSFTDAANLWQLITFTLLWLVCLLLPHRKGVIAHYKLMVIANVIREGWQPDWTDDDQWKYYPWFNFSSGSGLSYIDYGDAGSIVGSRLCVQNSKLARYMGEQFIELYEDMMLLR